MAMSNNDPRNSTAPDCDPCPLLSRRTFLRDASTTAAALAGLLATPAFADATPSWIEPLASTTQAKVYPFPDRDGVQIDKSEDVIIARAGGKVFAFNLACPHQNTAIRWQADKNRFECPKHKSHYTPDGTFVDGRATRGLDRFAVTRTGATLVVNLDALYEEDKHRDAWKAAFVTV
jgi:Rieske Fe-S protein